MAIWAQSLEIDDPTEISCLALAHLTTKCISEKFTLTKENQGFTFFDSSG